MNNALKSILSISAFSVAILMSSCKKDNTTAPVAADDNVIGHSSKMALVSTCPTTCTDRTDTITSEWIPASQAGSPVAFAQRYYSLDAGEVSAASSYNFYFSGQFLSRITSGATLGFFNNTTVPPSEFPDVTCADTVAFSTTNVVGNSMANNTTTAQGWYVYNFMNPLLVTPSWIVGIYFPGCNKYYAVKLTVFVESREVGDEGALEYRSNVVVQTKCLGCGA